MGRGSRLFVKTLLMMGECLAILLYRMHAMQSLK